MIKIESLLKYFIHNPGSDHPIHVRIINKIRRNGFAFKVDDIFTKYEHATYYPILYHWILATYFYPISIRKPFVINVLINLIKLLSFNFFLLSLKTYLSISGLDFLLMNLVFISFPFSYTFWNAKNTGLSARNFGLTLGQIYIYFLAHLVISDNLFLLIAILIISFLIITSSMMALQFIVLTAPLYALLFERIDFLIMLLLSYIFFYTTFRSQAKSHLKGLHNFYFNYRKYLAKIFIFKYRKNIFRDFVWDFWVKLFSPSTSLRQKIQYIYLNPLIEFIHGFPYLIIILFLYDQNVISMEYQLILIPIVVFFIVCLNPFRFLGEPQRYIEFIIPIISVLFVQLTSINFQLPLVVVLLVIIFLTSHFTSYTKIIPKKHHNLMSFLSHNFSYDDVLISNDQEKLKFCSQYVDIINYDTSKKINSFKEIDFFFEGQYGTISPGGLKSFYDSFNPNLLFINKSLYSKIELESITKNFQLNLVYKEDDFYLYEI